MNPVFDQRRDCREHGVILEEIKMDADNPDYLVHEIFSSNFWKDHPLGKPILGTRETVKRFDRAIDPPFYSDMYSPHNLLITAAGNLDHRRLAALAEERFADFSRSGTDKPLAKPSLHARISLRNKKELEQVHLCMGVPSYPVPHEDRFSCYVMNTLLGGGMSSRLFQNIRERQGLAYAVYSELNPYRDTGCLSIYAGTSRENAPKLVQSVVKEFREMKAQTITEEELRRAKDQLKGSLLLSLESSTARMSNLARQEMYFGHFLDFDEIIRKVEAVTAQDLIEVANDFFRGDAIALTVLGNLNGLRLTREQLAC